MKRLNQFNEKAVLPVLLKRYTHEYPKNLPIDLSQKMGNIQYIDFRRGYNDLSLLWGAINKIRDRSLSRVNRWILFNQFEILRLLHRMVDEQGNSEDYERQQTIISRGYEWNYNQISEHIAVDPMEYGNGEEVITILRMYEVIHKTREDFLDIKSDYRQFQGFWEADEEDYYFFTKFIIEVEGRFTECKPDKVSDLNSHRPMLTKYRRMVKEWNSSDDKYSLTREDLIRILDA